MIAYPIFYKKFGVRRLDQLINPLMNSVNNLFLPYESILHYVGAEDLVDYGISYDDEILRGNTGRVILFDHVTHYIEGADLGPPRSTFKLPPQMIREYHTKYRKTRMAKDIASATRDPKTLVVVNYALIHHMYRYMENFFTPYNKWHNLYKTVWAKVEAVAKESNRQQFILLDLPNQLPPVSLLQRAEAKLSRSVIEALPDQQTMNVMDLWMWLGENRAESNMGVLSKESLSKINLIWMEQGRWVVLNLGILDGWRKDPTVETAVQGNVQQLQTAILQRRILRMQMTITEAKTVAGITDEDIDASVAQAEQDEAVAKAKQQKESEANTLDDDEGKAVIREIPVDQKPELDTAAAKPVATQPLGAKPGAAVKKNSKLQTSHAVVDVDADKSTESDTPEGETMTDAEIDKDLQQLEKIHTGEETKSELIGYKPYEVPAASLESGVLAAADEMAKHGLLSAAEYRRATKLASRYKEIPNPFTKKGSLADLTVIKPDETMVAERTVMVDQLPGVTDASMLSSSLKEFDERYVKNVLKKDVVSMVLNVQTAGIAVQNYDIQSVDDYTDSYDIHTVKLVPVAGSPSTLRFRVPKIDENGVFKAGGVKYRMRKQRGD